MPRHHDIARALQAHKEDSGVSHCPVAARAGEPTHGLTAILDGHAPSVDRAADICDALGLEFYIGPPGTLEQIPFRLSHSRRVGSSWRIRQARSSREGHRWPPTGR